MSSQGANNGNSGGGPGVPGGDESPVRKQSPAQDPRKSSRLPKPSGLRVSSSNFSQPESINSSAASTPGSSAPRPSLRWRPSSTAQRRFAYSTDDHEDEVEADLEREYFEGYSDGLKERKLRWTKTVPSGSNPNLRKKEEPAVGSPSGVRHGSRSRTSGAGGGGTGAVTEDEQGSEPEAWHEPAPQSPRLHHHHHQIKNETVRNLERLAAQDQGDSFDDEELTPADFNNEAPHPHSHHSVGSSGRHRDNVGGGDGFFGRGDDEDDERDRNLNDDDDVHDDGNDDDDDGDDDRRSTSSVETFTLRERQDAINTTHPFGIRIWKPAVYKKLRSVQRIAEGDIHSTPGHAITWTVQLWNVLWTVLFGTVYLVVCTVAAATCKVCFWSPSAQEYGDAIFHFGVYMWFPFGQFVELEQDDNYLHEDLGEGRTLDEYERWQAGIVEVGRLFFGPPTTPSQPAPPSTPSPSPQASPSSHTMVDDPENGGTAESDPLMGSNSNRKRRLFGRGEWNLGRVLFFLWYYVILAPMLYLTCLICYLGVFTIPMGRVTSILADQLRRHPLALSFKPASSYAAQKSSSIILCTYRAVGLNYYKYTIDGTNIFFINLMLPVLFVIFDFYVLSGQFQLGGVITSPAFLFCLSLVSVIPLAYFIGQAVASISAQSSMGMGAAINAFFSTIVEVFLYAVALDEGKGDLVEGSIIGSILAGVLLLPGFSMCAGALRRKTQRYNPRSAGVSSTMLIFAIIGAFAPTIFYQVYGSYELRCSPCDDVASANVPHCSRCLMFQVPLQRDTLYTTMIQPFSYFCAILLFVSYIVGLWFTLRTHAAIIWSTPTASELANAPMPAGVPAIAAHQAATANQQHQQQHQNQVVTHQAVSGLPVPISTGTSTALAPGTAPPPALTLEPVSALASAPGSPKPKKHVTIQQPLQSQAGLQQPKELEAAGADSGGHDAPNWGRTKSTVILLGATVLYAIIAEILVATVDVVLQNFSISEKVLGLTVFALVPNTTEFLNAISFAMNGNIALSMEIGSAYALQVCLLQVPALVLYSIWSSPDISERIHDFMFTLVFPRWDLCMVIFCVFLYSYIYAEGKSNYFKGSILLLAYLVVMIGFYYADRSDLLEGINAIYTNGPMAPPALTLQS